MGVRIVDKDKGWKRYVQNIKKVGKNAVQVGVLGDGDEAMIATVHEFGNERAPQRSFIRSTFDETKNDNLKTLQSVVKKTTDGTLTVEQGLGLVGEKFTSAIKAKIRAHIDPPNAPATIARKGSSTPLVDTGRLINSITWALTK